MLALSPRARRAGARLIFRQVDYPRQCGQQIEDRSADERQAEEPGDEGAARAGIIAVLPQSQRRYQRQGPHSFGVIEREHEKLLHSGPDRVSPFFIVSAIVNLASGNVSIRHGAKGPNSATATACSAGAHAIGDSFRLIERGENLREAWHFVRVAEDLHVVRHLHLADFRIDDAALVAALQELLE